MARTKRHAERKRLAAQSALLRKRIDDLQNQLAFTPLVTKMASPIEGFELMVAAALWLLDALVWLAFLGRPHRSAMPPSPNTAGFKKLKVQRVDKTAFATELPSLPSPDHETVTNWFQTEMQAREGHAVKASDAYMHYANSGPKTLGPDRFYKMMRAILPEDRVKKRAAGVHYVGFTLHDPSPELESKSIHRVTSQ